MSLPLAALVTLVLFLACALFIAVCLSFGFAGTMFLATVILGGFAVSAAYEGRI